MDEKPVVDAWLTWTPLSDEALGESLCWDTLPWDDVLAATRTTRTDANGVFRFEHGIGQTRSGSVLWTTSLGFLAHPLLLGEDPAPRVPLEIKLAPSDPFAVRVVNADGTGVVGATVEQYSAAYRAAGIGRRDRLAAFVYRRTWSTGADGSVSVPALTSKQVLLATDGVQRARPWFGTETSDRSVELQLRSCFIARGRVVCQGDRSTSEPLVVTVAASIGDGTLWVTGTSAVELDGAWGPREFPVTSGEGYAFYASGGGFITETAKRGVPHPGETVEVDFELVPGAICHVEVVERETEKPLAGALVNVAWWDDARVGGISSAHSDDTGRAIVEGCKPGTVWIATEAPGHVRTTLGPIELKPGPEGTQRIELPIGRFVQGRCTYAGKPVRDFSIAWWRDQPNSGQHRQVFTGRADGTFEIDGVELGPVGMLATSEQHAQSRAFEGTLTADAPLFVELELQDPLKGHGFVVDAQTAEPVPTAEVQLYTSAEGYPVVTRGLPKAVGQDGRFELAGFAPGSIRFVVSAPGYAQVQGFGFATTGEELDLGTIALNREQPLTIRLVSKRGTSFAGYSIEFDGANSVPPATFDSAGVARVAGAAPGLWYLRLICPDESVLDANVRLVPGRDWTIDLPVDGNDELPIEVVPKPGESLPSNLVVIASMTTPAGVRVFKIDRVDSSGGALIDEIVAPLVMVSVGIDGQDSLATAIVRIADLVPPLRIQLGGSEVRLRVVDEHDQPIDGVSVLLQSPERAGDWSSPSKTGPDGECSFGSLDLSPLVAILWHAEYGIMTDVPIVPSERGEATVIHLVARSTIRVCALDGGEPQRGLQVNFSDVRGLNELGSKNTDEHGVAFHDALSEGNYTVAVASPGYWAQTFAVKATPEPVTQPLQVRRLGALELTVRDAAGVAITDATVDLENVEFATQVAEWVHALRVSASSGELTTDNHGRLRIDGLPHGDYRWRLRGNSAAGVIRVRPAALTKADLGAL